jgi:hypothetical protein
MERLPLHKQVFLFIILQNVSTQIGHYQMILGEINDDGLHTNCNAAIKYLLVANGSDPI